MKKKVIIVFIILVAVIGADVYLYKHKDNLFAKKEPNKKETKKEISGKNIEGIVYGKSENELILKSNNYFYTFTLNDKNSFKIGDSVKLTYDGDLNESDTVQNITVKDISKINLTDSLPSSWQDEGLFKEYYEQAYSKLQELSLEEKIGQLFLVRVPEKDEIEALKNYYLGGYILFGRDTKNETKDTLINKINSWQSSSKIPLLIAADEEGGTVVRISNNSNLRDTKFLSPQQVYANGGMEAIKNNNIEINNLLESLGINVNLAPVADVSVDPNDFIYERSLGQDATTTASYIENVIEVSKQSKVSDVLKHFPGYGNNKDTHTGISIDERPLDNFYNNDFLPFQAGINKGAEAIMVSHNIINAVEANLPASMSFNIHKIAINNLKFSGILMTDDLDMDAIKDYLETSSVVQGLLAGNNILILSDYVKATSDIKEAINNGTFSEDFINYNAFKVLAWKYYKGLI